MELKVFEESGICVATKCQKFGFRYSHSQDEVRQWDGAQFVNDFYYLMRDEYLKSK